MQPGRGVRRPQDMNRRFPVTAAALAALVALGLAETLKVTYAQYARLAAMFRTPQGIVTF